MSNLKICVVVGVFGCTTTTNIDESISLRPIESEGQDASSIQAAPGKVGKKDPMSELLHWAGNSQFRDGWILEASEEAPKWLREVQAIEHSDPETLKNLMEEYKDTACVHVEVP